jgi:hypothetical protein
MKYAFLWRQLLPWCLIALIAVQIPGMQYRLWCCDSVSAMALFLGGFCYRVLYWPNRRPVQIPTTCGQGYSMPWIKHEGKLEAPNNTAQVVARMFLEISFSVPCGATQGHNV